MSELQQRGSPNTSIPDQRVAEIARIIREHVFAWEQGAVDLGGAEKAAEAVLATLRSPLPDERAKEAMIASIIADELAEDICTPELARAAADRIACALRNNEHLDAPLPTKNEDSDRPPQLSMRGSQESKSLPDEKIGELMRISFEIRNVATATLTQRLEWSDTLARLSRSQGEARNSRSVRISDLTHILSMLPPKPTEVNGVKMFYADPDPATRLHQIRDAFETMLESK